MSNPESAGGDDVDLATIAIVIIFIVGALA